MSEKTSALRMARYNSWQNNAMISAANQLPMRERQRDFGTFFKSIEATFSHLYWADQTWLARFGVGAPLGLGLPESTGLIHDWDLFQSDRQALDQQIFDWVEGLDETWFSGTLSWYSGALGRDMVRPHAQVLAHIFNHQTHHRGQIHAMLSMAGVNSGVTDLAFMPE
ncbi:DinB family protein [Thioclava sp. GXIMD4216]|uniref:DinB family protein n=1 Tax=Thioclava litoralis TaxID=3076557 RepID=A0ABZ1E0U4_9RHOB|nr:DinB family protein [Thioclava sp. FTW29]